MIVLATASVETPLAERLIDLWATPADRADAGLRRAQTARSSSILARAALRALLFSQSARTDWNFRADSRGKLSVVDELGVKGPAVCLAHSRGWIACGLGEVKALGVDIEVHRPRNVNAMADWAFGPQERAAVMSGGAAAFYRIWTLREAMGKATGEGLALATDGIDRVAGGSENGPWRAEIEGRAWLLSHLNPDRDVSLAVAALVAEDDTVNETAVHLIDLAILTGGAATIPNR